MDKIGEMLITIKNAGRASKASVVLPYSNLRHAVAECLSKQNYVGTIAKKTDKKNKPVLEISISYEGRLPKVTNVERISKPSKRVYFGSDEIKPFKNGYGRIFLSTSKGIMTDKEARKENLGGEALFKIW